MERTVKMATVLSVVIAAATAVRAQEGVAAELAAPAAAAPTEPAAPATAAPDAAATDITTLAARAAHTAHPAESAVLKSASPEVKAQCNAAFAAQRRAANVSKAARADHDWARANWPAAKFVGEHCRMLDGSERLAERIAGHRPSQYEIECDPAERHPAGATAKLAEIWTVRAGGLPDASAPTWAAFEAATWPALAAAPKLMAAVSKQCAALERAYAVLIPAMDRETARLKAAATPAVTSDTASK